jgi:predicted acylesterase/phospholipase RssA
MKIEHLILCGGGPLIFSYIGLFKRLREKNVFNIENIKTIYSVSAGSLMAILLMLKVDFEMLEKYFIERPWNREFIFSPQMFIDLIQNKGMIDGNKMMTIVLKNLLESVNLSLNSTLKDLYDLSKIDFHSFTVNINNFSIVNISHKTHPEFRIIDVAHMSCAVPFIISPFKLNEQYYVDGAILKNYPIDILLQEEEDCEKEHILGVRVFNEKEDNIPSNENNNSENDNTNTNVISESTTDIYNYIMFYVNYIKNIINQDKKEKIIENEIHIHGPGTNFETIYNAINDKEYRKKLLHEGKIYAKVFLKYKNLV